MDRKKMRICLLSLTLAVIVFGIFYYVYVVQQDSVITEGTLVRRITEGCRNLCL